MRRRRVHHHVGQKPTKTRRGWRIALILAVLLLGGGGILLKLRWHAWFGNAPEAPYTIAQEISRVTLTPGEDFSRERTLSWLCGEAPRTSTLLVSRITAKGDTLRPRAFTPSTEVIASRSGKGCYYQVKLDSLNLGERYLYRIEVEGARPYSDAFSMPSEAPQTNFIYLGDIQDPAVTESKRNFDYLRRSPGTIDFFAFAGDQIEGPTDTYWRAWYESIGALSGEVPILATPGNHEYLKKGFARELDVRWVRQFGYPKNGPEDFLGRSYFIDFPLLRFIVLDTTDIMGLGSIRQHRSWLRKVLGESKQPWQIVLFHHAVDCVREGRKNLVMHYVFKDELISGGADLVLQGHDHGYARATTRTSEGDTIAPAFVISSASPKVYRNGFSSVHDRLGSGLQLYQRISIDSAEIRYASYRFPQPIEGHRDSIVPEPRRLYDSIVLYKGEGGLVRIRDYARDLPERFEFNAFGTDSKGRKRAAQYAKEVRDRHEAQEERIRAKK